MRASSFAAQDQPLADGHLVGTRAAVGQQHVEAVRGDGLVDAAQDVEEGRVIDACLPEGQNQAERIGAQAAQAARGVAGVVVEQPSGVLDALAGGAADLAAIVDGVRGGCDRHAGQTRDVAHGHPHPVTRTARTPLPQLGYQPI